MSEKKLRSGDKVRKNLMNLREEYTRSVTYNANWGTGEFVKKIDACLYGDYDIIRNPDKGKDK